ncbi:non-ribosomal peptide synthetase [Aquimarina spongiae]|uniref:Amino acid adenylation domain-containing protein n=1 Tax=Aquimarina spongiae TaxID=570521 RepID=A0A1M6LHL7_9FLAO|nr:non-ribosomal peptide synthetase [Aquimarina spongiae]SHJ70699.1 amino acid adenylation domain-containing protein [Aquimarina spongiae]
MHSAQKIDKSNVQDIFELNMAQKGMLFHYLEDNDQNLYNIQLSFVIKGSLNVDTLQEAISNVQSNNEVLRSVFEWEKTSKPLQIVLKESTIEFNYNDLTTNVDQSVSFEIDRAIRKDRERKFDLRQVPLRFSVLKIAQEEFIFMITHHHILYDGWSTGILLKELFSSYYDIENSIVADTRKPNYRSVLLNIKERSNAEGSEEYWQKYLEDYTIKPIPLHKDQTVDRIKKESIKEVHSQVTLDLIDNLVSEHRVTRATIVYAAYGILLKRYLNSNDVVFGTPISDRDSAVNGADQVMGNFINTIPMRIADTDHLTIAEYLERVNKEFIARNEYSSTSYNEIKEMLNLKPQDSLFDSILVIENYPIDLSAINKNEDFSLRLRSTYGDTGIPIVIHVFFRETLDIEIIYQNKLTDEGFITSFAEHFKNIIVEMSKSSGDTNIESLDHFLPNEKQKLISEFNNTIVEKKDSETILDLFNKQVLHSPDAIAVQYENVQWTYKELDDCSNELAHQLSNEFQIQNNDLIGICLDRSENVILSILGILKSGAAYVPIDPEYPASRKENIISNSGIKLLISEMYYIFDMDYYEGPKFAIDVEFEKGKYQNDPVHNKISPKNLAYVIYTSGSTGTPKGVMINHNSLYNYATWAKESYVGKDRGNFPLYTSISFDLTVTSIFTPLISGNSIIIYKEEGKEPTINKIIKDNRTDIIKLTPSHLKVIRDSHFSEEEDMIFTKKFVVGGEKLDTALARDIFQKFQGKAKIYNEYGPTEATVGCMIYEYAETETSLSVPIGNPIVNTQIYILDRQLRPMPIGVPGELYVSGNGVADGYINKPDLTAEKFLENPFVEHQKMYKTGDVVVKNPNGQIEFIGRQDYQVKIRGYRIELGEIENVLLDCDEILEAVVTVKEQNNDPFLLCYYTSSTNLQPLELKKLLEEKLPQYMVPSQFVLLDSMPLTINGKLDKKALPDPNTLTSSSSDFIAPETELEKELEVLWQEILGVSNIGVNDDFFTLGGHSLSATRLASKIKKELEVEISINDLFEHTTIRQQSIFIENQEKLSLTKISCVKDKPQYVPLSFGQERLWFIDQFEGSQHYHMPIILEVEENFDIDVFQKAMTILVNRHQPLRTVFDTKEGKPYQRILPENQWQIESEGNIEKLSPEEVDQLITENIQEPFDLSKDHKIRIKALKGKKGYEKLIMVIHHIAFDGWSVPIFKNELSLIYAALINGKDVELENLPIQYLDYSIWQNEYLGDESFKEGLQYWTIKLKDLDPLEIPTDFNRTKKSSYQGANYKFSIPKSVSQGLTKISQDESVSLFMVLLSGIKILLSKYTGQSDICVGAPVANREQIEVDQLIGFFVNTLALRTFVDEEQTFLELLHIIRNTTLEAQKYQQIPFEKIIDNVVDNRDLNRSPLFQVMLILQNEENLSEINLGNTTLTKAAGVHNNVAKFELTFDATQTSDGIEFIINYRTELFKEDTIKSLSRYLQNLLEAVATRPEEKIYKLPVTSAEDHDILHNFNETEVAYPEYNTILELFAEQVKSQPKATAVVFGEESLSFEDLNVRSNRLSNLLINKGVTPETIIPICIDRSLEMMIGILAILKSGGAYAPIDPEYPKDRIDFILKDVDSEFVITQSKYKHLFITQEPICIDQQEIYIQESGKPSGVLLSNDDLAYVIYTSGTTGKPKGVMNQHSGILNRLLWMRDYLGVTKDDVILQKTTFCFDVSVWELLLPLITGTRLVFAKPDGHKDPMYLQELIQKEQISTMHFVPSMLSVFLTQLHQGNCKSLQNVICSGEELKSSTVKEFRAKLPEVNLYNLYGPTEAAIDVTAINLTENTEFSNVVPIGKPVANTKIYIVDKYKNKLPIGIAGELLIGGIQVARGYLNRDELTKQKFIADPYEKESSYQLYKTGDLAKWLPDGNIEFLGRIDTQVKIRGYRIELGEIEATLEQITSVQQAAVIKIEDKNGDAILGAYVVMNEKEFDAKKILNTLKEQLPEYMIPSTIMRLEEIPLNHNGKLDRKRLPKPEYTSVLTTQYVAPRDAVEIRIAEIWKGFLNIDRIGVYDNFFELGGHSLLAVRVLSVMNKEFSVHISIQRFFELGNLSELGKYIRVISSLHKKDEVTNGITIEL